MLWRLLSVTVVGETQYNVSLHLFFILAIFYADS